MRASEETVCVVLWQSVTRNEPVTLRTQVNLLIAKNEISCFQALRFVPLLWFAVARQRNKTSHIFSSFKQVAVL
jgi:hypothetical protein